VFRSRLHITATPYARSHPPTRPASPSFEHFELGRRTKDDPVSSLQAANDISSPPIANMGACLSCLGLQRNTEPDSERQRLLYDDYSTNGNAYGTWGAQPIPPAGGLSAEDVRREQEEFNRIAQKASDQIVEIFPHHHPKSNLNAHSNGHMDGATGEDSSSQLDVNAQSYQDILLSLIPGDKSKRSIRIYPASRPSSSANDTPSMRSKGSSSRLRNGEGGQARDIASGVFVKLDVDFP
jgi:hypothetical protein